MRADRIGQVMTSTLGLSLVVAIFVVTATAYGGAARAEQRPRDVIGLRCPYDVSQTKAFCRAMVQTLSQISLASVVRRLKPGNVFRPRPGDLEVIMTVDEMTDKVIVAHLEWRLGGAGALQYGPEVRFDMTGSTVRPAVFENVADRLVKSSPEFLESTP